MKIYLSPLLLAIGFILSACTPHSASGVWKTTEDNKYGITKLIVSFDGRASFKTPKLDNATWHCFWSAIDKQETELNCTPSTNPDQEERFIITTQNQRIAELRHNDQLVATLTLQDENPSTKN